MKEFSVSYSTRLKTDGGGGEGKTETTQKRREDKNHENSIKNELKIVA